MSADSSPDPLEYAPDEDPITAREEYQPEPASDYSAREADPADIAEQAIEVPDDDPDADQPDGDVG